MASGEKGNFLEEIKELGRANPTTTLGQKFSKEVLAVLDQLYAGGLTGWGKDHCEDLDLAIASISQMTASYSSHISQGSRNRYSNGHTYILTQGGVSAIFHL